MKAHFSLTRRDLNVLIACLLSFSILMMPFVPIAAASDLSKRQSRVRGDQSSQAGQATAANAALPAPAPEPFAANVTATKSGAILNDDGDTKADPTNGVPGTTEKIEYTVTVSNTGSTDATNVVFTDTIDAHTTLVNGSITTQPIAVNDAYSAIGNVRIQVPDGASDLLNNDCDPDPLGGPCTNAGLTITTLAGDSSAPFAGTSANSGNVTAMTGDGSFQYNPAPGFEGTDTFSYTVTDGTGKTDTATVTITVSGMIWFVNAAAGGGGDGRLTTPFNCLVGTGCFQPVAADDPGDFIFLFSGTYNDNAALALLNNQKLIGAAASIPLAGGAGTVTMFTIPAHSDTLPATGQPSPVITSSASGIQLASGNTLRGFTVGNTSTSLGNYDILNTNTATVGILTILEVALNGNGGLFRADSGGTLGVSFVSASTSSAGSNGVHVAGGATGSVSIAGSGTITGVVGSDVLINNAPINFSCSSNITHALNSSMVDITAHSSGTVSFSGTLNASSGTGLQFSNADGTYNFTGTTTLNGGDAGIDILSGSAGTFGFGGATITNTTPGPALNVNGSSGGITITGAISKSTDGKLIDFDNYDTGTAAISGNLSCTSVCDGVEVTNDGTSSGTVNFSGATKTLTTGASAAVNLDNNDNGNVNFTGGGLDIDTTSGAGFAATGGGTVTVTTGTNNNTIDSTTGTSLNINGTNIGASGVTFRSINANGAANGIVLNTTGNSGGLTITGDAGSTNNASGCNIQNTTGHGIALTSTRTISLDQCNVTNSLGDGINGSSVTDFNYTNSTIAGAGDGANEFGIFITNLFGTNAITSSSVTNSQTNNLKISNNTSTSAGTLTINGSTFTTTDATNGGDAVNVEVGLGGPAQGDLTVNLTGNNNLNNSRGDGIQGSANDGGTLRVTVTGTGSNYNGNLGSAVNMAAEGTAQLFVLVQNLTNVSTGTTGSNGLNVINIQTIETVAAGPTVNATVQNNSITSPGPGAQNAAGIRVILEGKGTLNANINNNTISGAAFSANGIISQARAGNGTLNMTMNNNTISLPNGGALDGVSVEAGSSAGGDSNTICLNMFSNNSSTAAQQGYRLRKRVDPVVFRLQDFPSGTVQNWINVTKSNVGTTDIVLDGGAFTNAPAPCGTATLPAGPVMSSLTPFNVSPASMLGTTACKDDSLAAPISTGMSALGTVAPPVSTGLMMVASVVNALTSFAGKLHSLVGSTSSAAEAKPETASNASANTTVEKPSQVRSHHPQTRAVRANNANRNSALTTAARTSMNATPLVAGETVTINIGTLRAGDSVVITFQVTVNNPPALTGVPPAAAQVSNQGTVNFNDGATPLSVNTNTVNTPVDLFNSKTTVISDLEPANQGDTINFTATVVIDPAQTPTPPSPVTPTGTVTFKSDGVDIAGCVNVALNGSAQAVCTTNALTPPSHMITAVYSGDGNYDTSTSPAITQTVIACLTNPTVTSAADDGSAGTLRHTIANVCNNNTITFAIDPGTGPHTITLLTGEIPVTKNVIIKNASNERITVSGNNAGRVFNINSGKTVSIVGLTLTGGSATNGGAVLNDGTLTIVNSTLNGNAATGDGGAIANTATATSLTLINDTISGNKANGSGGGVAVLGGTATSVNSTITNNTADFDNNSTGTGGGIHNAGTTTLKNTIVAGNFNADGGPGVADDISGTVDPASSFNLIGTGGAGGLTNGVNDNQVGVADAGLGALSDNGGLVNTHALSSTSAAVEKGGNANLPADTFDLDGDMNTGETLPVDGRGLGFPRNADSQDVDAVQTVDIGAFELHPSVEDISDKSVAEDNVLNFSFNLGDGTGSLIASVTATSSNLTLIPNGNVVVSGSGTTRTLDITPALNANSPSDGTSTITVTVTATNGRTAVDTFVVTVTEVNDAPVPTNDTVADIAEDCASGCTSGKYVIPFATLLANDTNKGAANESGQTLNITAVSSPTGGTVQINGTDVEFTPTANYFGPAGFTYTVTDNGTTNGSSDPKTGNATVSFNITAVNDPPSFTIAADPPASNEDGGPQTVLNFATAISAGPNETGQVLTFNITPNGSTGTLTFASGPAINATTGTLTYEANAGTNGTATFNVTLSDDGSNTPPNSNTSAAQSFTITVNAQNDNPVVTTSAGNLAYTEGDAATAIDPALTVTDEDSPNLAGATVSITSGFDSAQDTLAFANQLGITGNYNSGTGVLTLTGTASVGDYQTALRAVTYFNGSNNPTTSRTITFTANDGVGTSAPATKGITIGAVNDAPVNTVPVGQSTNQNTPLTFSSGNGNQISVADADAGSADIRVMLTATNGTITLGSIPAGLSFGVGDGTDDATMTFDGTLSEVNTAMNGMTFNPTMGFSGAASLTINSNDLGNSGSGGPLFDEDMVAIQVATNVSIQDASVAEPKNGSVNMIFTVTLSAPAPAGGSSVNFTTQDIVPASINTATAGQDYTAKSGTVSFAAGEQFKTIEVQVLSDNKKGENNESFQVVLSSPVNATIADGTAIGTIIENEQAGTVLISELRTSGPGGAGDDFVEIYNNSNSPHTVNTPGGGYGLFKMGATCSATPVLLGVIPNGTTIPGRGHFLFTGSAYSLGNYGGSGVGAGDVTMLVDIDNDRNVALFATTSVGAISSANRLDAVGFGANTGGTCDLFREGATLTPTVGSVLEYTYFRDECGKKGNPSTFGPCPTGGLTKDSNVNADDFIFADTNATNVPAGRRLGAPGPQNLGSPDQTFDVLALLLDSSKSASGTPNRVRDTTAIGPNAAEGTMSIRRRFQNNTGAPVNKLRIRVVDISTTFVSGGVADLRLLSSSNITVSVNDSATCTAAGFATTPCNVTVVGTTLETPPGQPLGGGFNSSATIVLGTPLAAGASVNLQLLLGVQSSGSFKFFFNIEALP